MRTPRFCRSPGAAVTGQTTRTAEWKVTLELTVGGGLWPLNSGGGFTYGGKSESVTTETWTAAAGAHQQGQCMRYYRFELVCVTLFDVATDGAYVIGEEGVVHWDPRAVTTTVESVCTDTTIDQQTCDRTP